MLDNSKKILIAFIVILLGFAFLWYSYRPSYIVKKCSFEAKEKAIAKNEIEGKFKEYDRDAYFRWCLQEKGLVQELK